MTSYEWRMALTLYVHAASLGVGASAWAILQTPGPADN